MDCRHEDCTLFEGGVDKMPGKEGYDYLMCNDCSKILAKRNSTTDEQEWFYNTYRLYGMWSNLDKQKKIDRNSLNEEIKKLDNRITLLETKYTRHTHKGGNIYAEWGAN